MQRLAIFYTPHPDSEMVLSASVWLGRDVYGKKSSELVAIDGLSALRRLQLVSTPVHYGFHATIKPLHYRGKGVAPLYSFPLFLWWLHKLTPQLLPTLFLFELNASTLYLDLFKRNPYYSGVVLY